RDELVEGDAARRNAILSQMNQLDGDLRQQLQALRDVAPDPQRADQIIATATAWRTWRDETIRIAEAGDLPAAYRRLSESAGNPGEELVVQLDQLFADAQRLAAETQSASAADYQRGRLGVVVALLALVLAGLVVALVISRSITRPLDLLGNRIEA